MSAKGNDEVVVRTYALTKRYDSLLALEGLDLEVYRGEIFGYLGPNGAGKTTTIRLLMDFIRPTSGRAEILGMDTRTQGPEIKRHVGYLPGELALWGHLTGRQTLEYLGRLRGEFPEGYALELAERLGLDLDKKVRELSHGNRQKLGLVQTMMNRPELMIMDEPTIGLDPLVRQEFYQMLDEVRREGRTVFLSSHDLSEVERTCDRVGILRKGRLQSVEHVDALKHVAFKRMTLYLAEPPSAGDFEKLPGVSDVSVEGNVIRFQVSGELDAVIKEAAKYHVIDLHYEEPSLEEIFLTYYGEVPYERRNSA